MANKRSDNEGGGDRHALDVAVMPSVEELVPHINLLGMSPLELDDLEWDLLEKALAKPLTAAQRKVLADAIGYFIHSIRLKDILQTPRKYQNELEARIESISSTINSLRSMIWPMPLQTLDGQAISIAEAQKSYGGSTRDWNKAVGAAGATPENSEVLLADDHIRMWLFLRFQTEVNAARDGMGGLIQSLHSMKMLIDKQRQQQPKAGRDGFFELKILIQELLQIAKDAGDNLDLASHDIRDEDNRADTATNPAYDFVEKALTLTLLHAPSLVAELEQDVEKRKKTLTTINEYLGKRPGGFIDVMEEARQVIEGGSRR